MHTRARQLCGALGASRARRIGTAVCAGKFTSEAATSGFSVFGIGGADTAYAASALGQAQRAAMNDAVQQISQRLRSVR